jgi:hypothetical protein
MMDWNGISGGTRSGIPSAAAVCALLLLWGGGCGKDACNKDTDCKMPQICIAGACTIMGSTDAVTDLIIDMDVIPDQTEPDLVDLPDIRPDEIVDPAETDMEEEDTADLVEEDVEDIELPPATEIWSEDFSDPPVRWEYQNGEWSVEGGEYVQASINSFGETWVPAESWTDFAVEVSLMCAGRDTSAVQNILGVMVRVQQIARNKYYRCAIDLKNNKLSLYKFDQDVLPGYEELCAAESLEPTLADDVWYKLQVIVTGTSLTCRWLEGETAHAQVSAHDDSYPSGSIGLFAHNASGRFDNVIVYDHRPPEWPSAARRETCP